MLNFIAFITSLILRLKRWILSSGKEKARFRPETYRDGSRGSRKRNFALWQGRTAFCARSVLALVIATQEATNKDSNDFWYSTGAKSRSDADGGQKSPVRTAPNQTSRERVQVQTAHTPPAHLSSAADIPPWPRPPRARR